MPKYRNYNSEMVSSLSQVLDVFNDIIIDRRDGHNTVQKLITVACVNGGRSRILKSLENKNKTLQLPLIAVTMGGFRRDSSRAHELNSGVLSQTSWYDVGFNAPVPINIEYEITVVTKYHADLDQILANFCTMFNPDIYTVVPHPKIIGEYIKSQLIWSGDVSKTYPDNEDTAPARYIATTSFTHKSWLFPGMGENSEGPLIHKINFCPNLLSTVDENLYLDRWFSVPSNMTFSEFTDNVVCGLIKNDNGRDNWDFLPMSGGLSGYWNEISGAVASGVLSGSSVTLTGDLCWLLTQENYILLYAYGKNGTPLPVGFTADKYLDYCQATASGTLSSCWE